MVKRVKNEHTGEVFEETPDNVWTQKLHEWRRVMVECNHDVTKCAVPSPMPKGHCMFNKKPAYPYRALPSETTTE
jgi:hypothetical protein